MLATMIRRHGQPGLPTLGHREAEAACLVSFAADVNLVIGWNSSRPIKEYEEQAAFIVKGYV